MPATAAWRNSALSSIVTLPSRQTTRPSFVVTSGLTSTSDASRSRKTRTSPWKTAAAFWTQLLREAEPEGQAPRLERLEARADVDRLAHDRLRVLGGDLLDVHAALRRGHEHGGLEAPVEQDRGVELAVERQALLDEHPLDDGPLRTGLPGHERPAEQRGRDGLRLLGAAARA